LSGSINLIIPGLNLQQYITGVELIGFETYTVSR